MTKFYVTDEYGSEVEIEADDFDVDEDGRLVFVDEVDDFLSNEWHAVREEVAEGDEEGEDEDETAADLVDRLEETFADDLTMLLALSRVRAVLAQEDDAE